MPPRRSLRSSASLSAQTTPAKRATPTTTTSTTRNKPKPLPKRRRGASPDDSDPDEPTPSPSAASAEASGYEDEDASATQPSSSESDLDSSDDDKPPAKKRKQNTTPKASGTYIGRAKQGQELWRPGVSAGLGPGKEVVIEKPKPRAEGKVKYKDGAIHPNTMLFLAELKENNDRVWLKMHDPDYRTSWNDFTSFLECVSEKLMEIDEEIPELPVKDLFFRVYRDVRFSKDQTPYKPWFSAAWSRTGRKGPYACYYVQIAPGRSFVGGGLWQPEAAALAALRADIDQRPHRIKQVLLEPRFRKEFLGLAKEDAKKAVKVFAEHNSSNALKSKPKGYDADHKDIELLKLRNFTIGRKLSDNEVVEGGLTKIAESFSCLVEFNHYINSVVMPDEDDGNEEESGDE